MKIAIDCRMSGKSGIGAFLDSMLPTFLQTEHSYLLLGLGEEKILELQKKDFYSDKRIEFLSCPIKTFSVKELFFFPKTILKKINACDLYFTPYCNVPSGIKVPVYSTIHDLVFLDMKGLSGRFGTLARKFFYKRAVKKSKALFTVSNFSKQRITELLHCKKDVTVVYSGVPLYSEDYFPDGSTKKTDTVIFIGNIKKHKGLATLIPAFCEFRNRIAKEKNVFPKLLIVGSKENFRSSDRSLLLLQEDSEKNGITFTGFIPDSQLLHLISQAKILIQPSFYEGFGVPPLQALYAGTKAIISDIAVFKEIYEKLPVTYFKCGDSSDLAEKMYCVWNEEKELESVKRIYSYSTSAKIILEYVSKDH